MYIFIFYLLFFRIWVVTVW